MENFISLAQTMMIFGLTGMAGALISIGMVIYLKVKWLLLLEDILDDGIRFYSLNIFLAGQGVLQYATVFLSSFHAKRYGMLEKRNDVPKHVQRLFIFTFFVVITSFLLMILSFIILENYIRPE
tara:strand:- start:653 stop:1024 length:372 start_codon:yes stop_codon:yes gene_type:complete